MATIFGERLRHLRKAQKLTQKELAQKLFVSQTRINRYEHGRDEPNYQKLILWRSFWEQQQISCWG